METLRLILGLLLPWASGFACLRALESGHPFPTSGTLARQLGYGLFLGYAGLQGLILLTPSGLLPLSFYPILGWHTLIAAAFILALRLSRRHQSPAPAPIRAPEPSTPWLKALFWCLGAWAAFHLCLAVWELLQRPVYPWDAWLAWVYRAKAWYFSAEIIPLADRHSWMSGAAASAYTMGAHDYPSFASIMPLWAALALGQWSETLVNTPVIACAAALALGLYGQLRAVGGGPVLAISGVYLLLSVPLAGTHIALAGYADIWMSGLIGLGFIALLRGLGERHWNQVLLGLLMTLLAIGVKHEAVVWFYSGLILLLLCVIPTRTLVRLAAGFSVLIALLVATDNTLIQLPWLGSIGITEGVIHIPFAGSHALQLHNVWSQYGIAFFAQDSWNLLWAGVLIMLVCLLTLRGDRWRKPLLVFLLLFGAAQAFIFGLTEQGQWAQSYTAINRLPLHFLPALIFSLLVCSWRMSERYHQSAGTSSRPGGPIVLASVVAIAAALIYLGSAYTGPAGVEPRAITPGALQIVVGGGGERSGGLQIRRYQDGLAIASSGDIELEPAHYPVLGFDLEHQGSGRSAFFWRLRSAPADIHRMDLAASERGLVRLADHPDWHGSVNEIGLLFFSDASDQATLNQLSLQPATLTTNIALLWRNWTTFQPWSQRSVNYLQNDAGRGAIPLPLLASVWLLLAAALGLLMRRISPAALCLCALAAWAVLDVRWSLNQWQQAQLTGQTHFEAGGQPCIAVADDCDLAQLAALAQRPGEPGPVLIQALDPEDSFRSLRLKYHLLPRAAAISAEGYRARNRSGARQLMLLSVPGARADEAGYQQQMLSHAGRTGQGRKLRPSDIMAANGAGLVLSLTPDTDIKE